MYCYQMYLILLLQFVLAGFIVAEIQSLTSRDTRLNELQIINAGVPIISEYTPHTVKPHFQPKCLEL